MAACIRRTYHGSAEDITYKEFVRSAIQDDEAAARIARMMLDGRDPYDYNADEPEFYEEFEIIDREALIAALATSPNHKEA